MKKQNDPYSQFYNDLDTFDEWCEDVGGEVERNDKSSRCQLPGGAGSVYMDLQGIEVDAESTGDIKVESRGKSARRARSSSFRDTPPEIVSHPVRDKDTIHQPETIKHKGSLLIAENDYEQLSLSVTNEEEQRKRSLEEARQRWKEMDEDQREDLRERMTEEEVRELEN